jgi:hypothetical protein
MPKHQQRLSGFYGHSVYLTPELYTVYPRSTPSTTISPCLLQGLPAPDGYNEEWLAGFVERLSAFDRDMNTVVQNSRILAGIPPPALSAAGKVAATR